MSEDVKPLPKAQEKDLRSQLAALQAMVEALETATSALLVGMKDVQEFTGREHMPDGEFLGEKF